MNSAAPDLHVESISSALLGKKIDVIVAGSIGAIESPRFLRALRRLGAEVYPWLTRGGSQFTTPISLGWASGRECTTEFSESAKHIAFHDACVIAPASANFIEKIISGRMDSPASSLVQSYLGQKKLVIVIPNMHESLALSPFIEKNLEILKNYAVVLKPRFDEHKLKFPDPQTAALHCAHWINKKPETIFVTMGATRSYYDDVRYLSNYSSGAMGTEICKQAYARGYNVDAVVGPCAFTPDFLPLYRSVVTASEMLEAVQQTESHFLAAFFVAAVLDYEFTEKKTGKTRSNQSTIQTVWKPTAKVIAAAQNWTSKKIAFKYEIEDISFESVAKQYIDQYNLFGCFVNLKKDVSSIAHQGIYYLKNLPSQYLMHKKNIAEALVQSILP